MIQKILARRCVPLMVLPLVGALPVRAQLLPEPQVPSTAAPLSFEAIFASTTPAPVTIRTADLKGEWRLTTIRSLNEFSPTLALLALPAARDKEAQRLVKAMPNWNPGKMNGKAVKCRFVLPVKFTLR